MTNEQIENEIENAMRKDGFPYETLKKLNDHGVWITFMNTGIRWRRTPFN
jgi:hypothetical protein